MIMAVVWMIASQTKYKLHPQLDLILIVAWSLEPASRWSVPSLQQTEMCHQKPCFTSLCGLPLSSLVPAIGLLELGITLVATTLNLIKYIQHLELVGEECLTRDVCIGPLIKVRQ